MATEMFPIKSDITGTFNGVPLPDVPVSAKVVRQHKVTNNIELTKNNLCQL